MTATLPRSSQRRLEAQLLEFASSLAAPLRALPALRRLSLRVDDDTKVSAAAQERVRARCVELCAACPGKRLEFHYGSDSDSDSDSD